MPQVATRSISPSALHAQLYATSFSSDNRPVVLSVHVDGATRPLRALLDSGATNNFVCAGNFKNILLADACPRVFKNGDRQVCRWYAEDARTAVGYRPLPVQRIFKMRQVSGHRT